MDAVNHAGVPYALPACTCCASIPSPVRPVVVEVPVIPNLGPAVHMLSVQYRGSPTGGTGCKFRST